MTTKFKSEKKTIWNLNSETGKLIKKLIGILSTEISDQIK